MEIARRVSGFGEKFRGLFRKQKPVELTPKIAVPEVKTASDVLFEKAKTIIEQKIIAAKADNRYFSPADEVRIANDFYCNILGYSIRYEGLLLDKAKILDNTGKIIAYGDGKPSTFKDLRFQKTDTKIKDFLESRLREKLEHKEKLTAPEQDEKWLTPKRKQFIAAIAPVTAAAITGVTVTTIAINEMNNHEANNTPPPAQVAEKPIPVEKSINLYKDIPENQWTEKIGRHQIQYQNIDEKAVSISTVIDQKGTIIITPDMGGRVILRILNSTNSEQKDAVSTLSGLSANQEIQVYRPISPDDDLRTRPTDGISHPLKANGRGEVSFEVPGTNSVTKVIINTEKKSPQKGHPNDLFLIVK